MARFDWGGKIGEALGTGLQQGFQQFQQQAEEQRVYQQQQKRQAEEQSKLTAALKEVEEFSANPNLTPDQKQLGIYRILSSRPDLAKAINDQQINIKKNQIQENKPATPKNPLGGIKGVPIPPEIVELKENIKKQNPNASASELESLFQKNGIAQAYYESDVETAAKRDELNLKKTQNQEELKQREKESGQKETSKLREDIAIKGLEAQQSIKNKERALELIDTNKLDDPTVATFLESLPFNYGKRFLNPETIEYKAGLVDEFKDLRNLFSGATRVKELDILEHKIADLYLTDEQKKRVLKARINSLNADVLKSEIAAQLEQEMPGIGIGRFTVELNKRLNEKMKPLADQAIDEITNVFKEAETIKSRELDPRNPSDAQIGKQIFIEAGKNKKKAIELAKEKGYKFKE